MAKADFALHYINQSPLIMILPIDLPLGGRPISNGILVRVNEVGMFKKAMSFVLLVFIFSSGIVYAHTGATGVVKMRMEMMKGIASNMKTIANMLKGQEEFDPSSASAAAKQIGAHANDMPDMFPEGSTDKPSEALPEIWENWDEFVAMSLALSRDAKEMANLAANASSATEIEDAFKRVGKSCGSCHEKYRLEHN